MPVAAAKPAPEASPTVVVLSSDEALRDAVAYWFNALSISALATADAYVANKALRSATARLLVIDRMMPPWPGLDTFLQLKAINPSLRIAYVDDGSWDGAILARVVGASVVLQKPLDRQRVIEALGRSEIKS